MSEDSILHASNRDGPRRSRKTRSIFTQVVSVVLLYITLVVVISFTAISTMQAGSRRVDKLTTIVGPLRDGNEILFRKMTLAQSDLLKYRESRDREALASFLASKPTIAEANVGFQNEVIDSAQQFGSAIELKLTNLATIQQESAMRWLDYSTIVLFSPNRSDTSISATEAALFSGFARVNDATEVLLKSEIIRARIAARSQLSRAIILTIAVSLLGLLLMTIFGLRLAGRISTPIISLNGVIKRHHDGEKAARAVENRGSTEIRDLAHSFNTLVVLEAELEKVGLRDLELNQLTFMISGDIRKLETFVQALEAACTELGMWLSIDRVFASTLDADLKPTLTAQWNRPDLPPLGEIPDDLSPEVVEVIGGLWQSSDRIVSHIRPAPDAQTERQKAFYRYTDAQAMIIIPMGVGEKVIGMICVCSTVEPRHWEPSEVSAVDRVASHLTQFFVEKTYREQAEEHVAQLEQINRLKDTFLATVSHELRTPLTSIIGYLEVISDGHAGDLTDEQARMLEVMDRNADRLLKLIEDLLALNKRESNPGKIELANVSMSELIASACHDLSPLAESGAIKIDCDAGPEGAVVQGDHGQLQSAVVNIVSNAIKFSPRGGVVTLSCALDDANRQVHITCRDRGIGIPAGDLGELFQRFYRGSNAMTKFIPGTGLGLTIVKQIVDDHGGKIHLDSVEGEGTTVVIDLPLAPQDSM